MENQRLRARLPKDMKFPRVSTGPDLQHALARVWPTCAKQVREQRLVRDKHPTKQKG